MRAYKTGKKCKNMLIAFTVKCGQISRMGKKWRSFLGGGGEMILRPTAADLSTEKCYSCQRKISELFCGIGGGGVGGGV